MKDIYLTSKIEINPRGNASMQIKDDRIILEIEDHLEFSNLLYKKLKEKGIPMRQALFFPVSSTSSIIMNALNSAINETPLKGQYWSPGMENMKKICSSANHIIFIDLVSSKPATRVSNAKKTLTALSKKLGMKKQLKKATYHMACWIATQKMAVIGGNIEVIEAAHADEVKEVIPLSYEKNLPGSIPFSDACEQLGWELDYKYKEKHQVVLDKLKSDLWD